jgi:hypothetical protein
VSPDLRAWFSLGARPRVPDEVRAALHGERPLAACRSDDGSWLVGTRDRLHTVGGTTESWPWEEVLRADWDEETRRFELVPVGQYGLPVDRRSFVLDDAVDLLGLVRERVSASVVLQRRVAVRGKRGFGVFARRPPHGGGISWAFELDEGVDPHDPDVRAAMDDALAEAQGSLGVEQG